MERQVLRDNGTIVPALGLYSTEANKISVDSIWYSNRVDIFKEEFQLTNDTNINGVKGEYLMIKPRREVLTNNGEMGSILIMITHKLPLTPFPWTVASIVHPSKFGTDNLLSNATHDLFNQYYFRPGHFVEIRYTPIHVISSYRPGVNATLFRRFCAWTGFGGEEHDYSYRSSVDHSPFPEGMYTNTTSIIVLRPQSNVEITVYAQEKIAFRDVMSSVGGLIGIVGSVIVFLFGSSLISPWGFFSSIPYFEKRITESMSKAYDGADGLSRGPFTTKIEDTGSFDRHLTTNDEKLILLKERVDELEIVLSEYYLNTEIFGKYAREREKIKLERAATRASALVGKRGQGGGGVGPQHMRHTSEPVLLSPYLAPDTRSSQEQYPRGHSPEPSVTAYYEQQQKMRQGSNEKRGESMQSLLRTSSDDEEDQQFHGLLPHYQQQQPLPPPPLAPRPPMETVIPMAFSGVPATAPTASYNTEKMKVEHFDTADMSKDNK
ncbi:hypothetical protein BGX34_010656 [Mortierella sp. NVP85]|nr:hypothetical protein BGX34_010656 [Mortierella sp. NVP85]